MVITVWLFSYRFVVHVCGHVFYMYCSCSNKLQWLEDGIIQEIVCVMHGINVFDSNVWFANYLHCIKRWVIGQYTSGYLDYRYFPVLYILLVNCHQYQIHSSMTVLHTYAVCYSYVHHSKSRLLHWVRGKVLITTTSHCDVSYDNKFWQS